MQPRRTRRALDRSKFKPAIETLETRQLLSAYFVDTDSAYSALNSKNLAAGDVVLLKGGTTFHGQLYLDSNDKGVASNPIVISSYDPATRKQISSTAAASARATIAASSTADAIYAYNTAGLKISGLNVVGPGATTSKGAGVEFFTDLPNNVKLNGITIDHVTASGFGRYGVAVGSWAGKSGYSNVKMTYVSAHDNGSGGIMMYGKFDATSTAYAHKNLYIGFSSAYNNYGFAGTTDPSGSGIVLSDVDGAVVEHTTTYNNGKNNTAGQGPVGLWAWDANNVNFQYNESHHNRTSGGDGVGFDLDGGVANSVMQYNYAHDNDGAGFGLYQFTGARKWNNNVVRNNVSVNNALRDRKAEISLWTNGSPMTNASVFSNTLVVNSLWKPILVGPDIQASIHDNAIQYGGTVDTSKVGVNAGLTTTATSTTTTTTSTAASTTTATATSSTTVAVTEPVPTPTSTTSTDTTTTADPVTTTTSHPGKGKKGKHWA